MVADPCPGGLRLSGVRASLDGFNLGPVDVEVPPSSILAVAGPNGSGKTTLLRVIAGLERHNGTVHVCGHAFNYPSPGRAGLVEIVPSEPQADPYARVEEIFDASGVRLAELEGAELGRRVARFLPKRFGALSSGEKRLVCLARGLYSARPVLLVDEPFAHLDIANQVLVARELRRRSRRGPLVIALHELHLLPLIATRVLLLSQGRAVLAASADELASRISLLSKVYGAPLLAARADGITIILPTIRGGPVPGGGGSEGPTPEGV